MCFTPSAEGTCKCTKHLEILDLSRNRLSMDTLEKAGLDESRELKELYLGNNLLSSFRISTCDGLLLSKLKLENNQLRNISQGFFRCTKQLEHLDLTGNGLSTESLLEAGLDEFRNLKELYLGNNTLSSFPIRNCNGSNISILSLENNQLSNISQGLFRCTKHLTFLDLSANNLSAKILTDAGLNNLRKLKTLNLSSNNISSLNTGMIDEIMSLVTFSCQDCDLVHLEKDSLPKTTNLINLTLSHNNLQFISNDTFLHLTNLKTLDLNYNKLTVFETNGGLPSLQNLFLQQNYLQRQPNFTAKHLNLQVLNLNVNRIDNFQSTLVEGLVYLRELRMAHNIITNLQYYSIGTRIGLKLVDFSHNLISYAGLDIYLYAIDRLNLSYNLLKALGTFNLGPPVLRVCSVLFDYRVETEISICLETQKLLSQGPLIGQHSQLSSLHIRVTQGQGVGALVNAIFTLPVWVHS